jgi:hypothetical protein
MDTCNQCGGQYDFYHEVGDKKYCSDCFQNIGEEYKYWLECD